MADTVILAFAGGAFPRAVGVAEEDLELERHRGRAELDFAEALDFYREESDTLAGRLSQNVDQALRWT